MAHSRRKLAWFVRLVVAGLLTWAAWLAVAQAIAEWYFHRETLQGFRAAVRWDPRNPEYHAALARALEMSLEGDVEEIVHEMEIATRLGPRRADYWAHLAAVHELRGDAGKAESAYQAAHRLFPNSPDINWKLGNYFVRSGRLIEAMRAFRTSLTGDSALQRPAFYIAWRATEDNDLILNELVPPEPERLLAYLAYLAETDRMDAARETWKRLMSLNAAFEPRAAFGYLDALIRARRLDELESAWNALAERFPLQFPRDAGARQLIVNSGFEFPISNGGLDWRIGAVEGVTARMDRQFFYDGTHALRLDFDGSTNLAYAQLLQYVLVRPHTSYRFIGYIRSRGITTDSGPRTLLGKRGSD